MYPPTLYCSPVYISPGTTSNLEEVYTPSNGVFVVTTSERKPCCSDEMSKVRVGVPVTTQLTGGSTLLASKSLLATLTGPGDPAEIVEALPLQTTEPNRPSECEPAALRDWIMT